MAREDLHFRLRIPDTLKDRVEEAAALNKRSMTAEIVARLESSFGERHPDSMDTAEFVDDLGKRLIKVVEHSIQSAFDKMDGVERPPPQWPEGLNLLDWLQLRGVDVSQLKRNPRAVNQVKRRSRSASKSVDRTMKKRIQIEGK